MFGVGLVWMISLCSVFVVVLGAVSVVRPGDTRAFALQAGSDLRQPWLSHQRLLYHPPELRPSLHDPGHAAARIISEG